MCWDGSTSLVPRSSLLTQTQSKEKAPAKLPPAPAVAAGRQWELSTGDSLCPRPTAYGERAFTGHSEHGRKPKPPPRWVSATLFQGSHAGTVSVQS